MKKGPLPMPDLRKKGSMTLARDTKRYKSCSRSYRLKIPSFVRAANVFRINLCAFAVVVVDDDDDDDETDISFAIDVISSFLYIDSNVNNNGGGNASD